MISTLLNLLMFVLWPEYSQSWCMLRGQLVGGDGGVYVTVLSAEFYTASH